MKFFRNPEITVSMLWHLFLLILSAILGFCLSPAAGYLMAFFSLLYLSSHYLITWKRYRKLEQLGQEIDDMLHNQTPIHFENFSSNPISSDLLQLNPVPS